MVRPELLPPRTLSSPVAAGSARYEPWYEVSVLVEVSVGEWGWRDTSWHHWAVPVHHGKADPASARRFDPGRRAARPGSPAGLDRSPPLDARLADLLAAHLLASFDRKLYRHRDLGLVSGLSEGRESFRRRCVSGLGTALRTGGLAGDEGAAAVAAVRSAIEERRLDEREFVIRVLKVGVGWYSVGTEPIPASDDLLVKGAVRRGKS